MNITLSADKDLITKSRDYARKHNTTLNNIIREYLRKLVNEGEIKDIVSEFEKLAANFSGKSQKDYTFNREEIYSR